MIQPARDSLAHIVIARALPEGLGVLVVSAKVRALMRCSSSGVCCMGHCFVGLWRYARRSSCFAFLLSKAIKN